MNTALDQIVGKHPVSIWVSPGSYDLWIICEEGTLILQTHGDCCSESWWADIVEVTALIGERRAGSRNVVTKAYEVDMPTPDDGRTRQEYDIAYGYKIRTDWGEATLVFRNSSNGYYGGWCDPEWHKGVTDEPPADWIQVTSDWSS